MASILICLGLVALALVAVLLIGNKYGKLLSPGHLSELSQLVAQLKAAALDKIIDAENPPEHEVEPAYIQSSAKLLLTYSILKENDVFIHHFGLSHESGILAMSALTTLSTWLCYFLQLDSKQLQIGTQTNSPVYHLQFKLPAGAEEQNFEEKSVRTVSKESISKELWQQLEPQRAELLQQLQRDAQF